LGFVISIGSLFGLKVTLSTAKKQAVKASAAKVKGEKELEATQQKLLDLEKEQQEMEADAMAVIQAVDNAKTMMQQQEEELKTITAQFGEMKKKLTDIKTVVVDVESELRKCEVVVHDNKKKIDHWSNELVKLREVHRSDLLDRVKEMKVALHTARKAALASNTAAAASGDTPALSESSMQLDMSAVIVSTESEVVIEDIDTNPSESELAASVLPDLTEEDIQSEYSSKEDIDSLKAAISKLEAEKEKMKKDVNLSALMEYIKKDADYR
jgi:structural maintenance of chromosome 4